MVLACTVIHVARRINSSVGAKYMVSRHYIAPLHMLLSTARMAEARYMDLYSAYYCAPTFATDSDTFIQRVSASESANCNHLLDQFGAEVVHKAIDKCITEDVFVDLTDADLMVLNPDDFSLQIKLRKLRDSKKNQAPLNLSTDLLTPSYSPSSPSPPPSQPVHSPSLIMVHEFISVLDLNPKIVVVPKLSFEEVGALMEVPRTERMNPRMRRLLQAVYADHVKIWYYARFNSHYVDGGVIGYVAASLIKYFPSLRDKTNTTTGHDELFVRQPKSGLLYEAFKNRNRALPPNVQKRPKRKGEPVPSSSKSPILEPPAPSTSTNTPYELAASFQERREWILGDERPTIEAILQRYQFWKKPDEFTLEFLRLHPASSYARAYNQLTEVLRTIPGDDEVSKVSSLLKVMNIKGKKTIEATITADSPEVWNGYPALRVWGGLLYVTVFHGLYFQVEDITTGLLKVIDVYHTLDIHYHLEAKRLLEFIAYIRGDIVIKYSKLSRIQKHMIDSIKTD